MRSGLRGGLVSGLTSGPFPSGEVLPAFDFAPALDKAFTVDGSGNVTLTTRRGPGVAFSRASGATFTDSDGKVKYAPENILSRCDVAAPYWAAYRSTISAEGPECPSGALVTKVTEMAENNTHYVNRSSVPIGVGRCIFSIYARAGTATTMVLSNNINAGNRHVRVDLSDGEVTLQGSEVLECGTVDVGNGWWRVWAVYADTTYNNFNAGIISDSGSFSYMGDPSRYLYFSGAMVSRGDELWQFMQTIDSEVYGPRFEHDPITGECLGLLVEEQRTNLVYPSTPDNLSLWATGTGGPFLVTENSTDVGPAPDGSYPTKVECFGSGNFQRSIAVVSGTTYATSIYARTASGTVTAYLGGTAPGVQTGFTASTDWERFTHVDAAEGTGTRFLILAMDAGEVLYLWGAQVEAGTFASSLIPTNGASATRSADVLANVAVTNDGHGTLVATLGGQFPPSGSYSPKVRLIYSGGGGTRIGFGDYNSAAWSEGFVFSYSGAVQYQSSAAAGRKCSLALAFAADDVRFAYNGALGALDVSAEIPDVDRLQFGSSRIFSRVRYYNKRLPDAKLQTLTAP